MSPIVSTTYIVNSIDMSGNANNGCASLDSITIYTGPSLNAGGISEDRNDFCVSGTPTFTLSGSSGGVITWQTSTVSATGPWTTVLSGPSTYSATFTQTTYVMATTSCPGNSVTSNVITLVVSTPVVGSTTPGSRCGIGTVTLGATPGTTETLHWYSTATGGAPYTNPSAPVAVTGFNNDIVAGGVGSSSILGTTYPAIGMDGQNYTYIDNTYKYVAANALPTCYMPTNHLAPSLLTSGLTYQLQDYGAGATLNNNALSLSSLSSGYVSPLPSSGTLTLTTPASYANLVVLYESVMNTSPMTVDATVTFTDATTQSFPANACVNWFTVSAPAYSGMGRTTPAGVIQCGTTPNMFELNLPISTPNQLKQVASITFNIPTVLSGTLKSNMNYFHAMHLHL